MPTKVVKLEVHLDTESVRDAEDTRSVLVKIAEALTELLLCQVVVTSEVLDEEDQA